MSTPELSAKGVNGQIELYNNKVCIIRKGIISLMTQGLKGNKDIMISTISSIQLKKAGLTNGYIQFSFMGGKEAKGGLLQGTHDENTVMFHKKHQPLFEQIKETVEARIVSGNNSAPATSDADELLKFAELRDKGILTEEEFQKKKAQVLGI